MDEYSSMLAQSGRLHEANRRSLSRQRGTLYQTAVPDATPHKHNKKMFSVRDIEFLPQAVLHEPLKLCKGALTKAKCALSPPVVHCINKSSGTLQVLLPPKRCQRAPTRKHQLPVAPVVPLVPRIVNGKEQRLLHHRRLLWREADLVPEEQTEAPLL